MRASKQPRYRDRMVAGFDVQPFELLNSPWLQCAVNERFRGVWVYWLDVPEQFRPEKDDVEGRVEYVLERNNPADLLAFAARDREVVQGLAAPPRTVVDPDPVRVAAFRIVELANRHAIRELRLESLAPAAEHDFVCQETPGLWPLLSPRDHLFSITHEVWPAESRGNVPHFVVGNRAVYPHPFIWPNRELMRDVIGLGIEGFDAKIAIDPARATSRENAADELLLDYWFGCKLTRNTIDSLDVQHLRETWHMRPANRATALTTLPLAATVFRWSADGHVKKLEVNEIAPRDSRAAQESSFVVNRYLHSLRDTQLKQFIHVDGAVRAYDAAAYHATQENPKAACGEPVHYRKLFRVDGAVNDDMWGRIVAHFFRGNELVIEYFGEAR
jgi:hypothetical protein